MESQNYYSLIQEILEIYRKSHEKSHVSNSTVVQFKQGSAKPQQNQATCEHVNLHAPTGNFESLTAILAETIVRLLTVYCSIGGIAYTVLLECHTDCSIRVS